MLGTAGQQGGRLPLLSCQLGLLQPFVPGAARRRRLGGLQWIPPPPPILSGTGSRGAAGCGGPPAAMR